MWLSKKVLSAGPDWGVAAHVAKNHCARTAQSFAAQSKEVLFMCFNKIHIY
jgi:hypothetical protein